MSGRAFLAAAIVALTLMSAGLLALHGVDEDGLRAVVRATARTSVVLFAAAFVASALRRRWRTPATAWLLRSRRQVGLAFAWSHLLHLLAILGLYQLAPEFAATIPALTVLGGGAGYAFIAAMAATSNDASVRLLGRRRWRALHWTGMWIVFGLFAFTYGGRAPQKSAYVAPLLLLLAALAVRLLPTRARVD